MTASAAPRVVREMHPNGTVQCEYAEVDGKIEGHRRYWYPAGQLLSEAEFVLGIANGRIREWTKGGLLCLSATRKNGVLDGRYESWWDDGKPKEHGDFKDEVRQPGYRWYHTDGTLWREL